MKWHIHNLHIYAEVSDHEKAWLHDYLVVKDRRYSAWKKRYEESLVRLYDRKTSEFPTGFARATYKAAKLAGLQVEVVDHRVAPCAPDAQADLEWLRHHPALPPEQVITHQREAVDAVVQHRRGIIKVPTGGGKTEIACGLARLLPCRWLFLVHRGDLMVQTAERYKQRTGLTAGMVGDGLVEMEHAFTVAMFQTIHRGLSDGKPAINALLAQAQGLVVDECHTLPADTFYNVAMHTPNAYFRVGLSGTPLQRGDKRSSYVIAALGPLIYHIQAEPLIQLGILSRPTIRFVEVRQQSNKPTWQGVYGEAIIRSKVRNRALLGVIQRARKPCLVFVQQLAHGKNLLAMMRNEGIRAEFVWGSKALHERKAAVARLTRGDLDVLVANVIFQEGIDIPCLRSVVMGTGGASAIAALQRLGRGLRVTSTKNTVEIWDIADADCGCIKAAKDDPDVTPHSGCRWLVKHTKERMRAYTSEDYPHVTEASQMELTP